MKTKLRLLPGKKSLHLAVVAVALAVPPVLYAVFQVTELEVGYTNNSVTVGSAAIGNNNAPFASSLAVGYFGVPQYNSLTVGGHNKAAADSFAAGNLNDVSRLSGAVGYANGVNVLSPSNPNCSMAIGDANTVYGSSTLAAGSANFVRADCGVVLGRGLESTANDATIVGSYNTDKAALRFAVGNGTSATTADRSNALEVYANGDIVMKKQGDISMGAFGPEP